MMWLLAMKFKMDPDDTDAFIYNSAHRRKILQVSLLLVFQLFCYKDVYNYVQSIKMIFLFVCLSNHPVMQPYSTHANTNDKFLFPKSKLNDSTLRFLEK